MGGDKKKIILNKVLAAVQLSFAGFVLFIFGYGTCDELIYFDPEDMSGLIIGIFGDIIGGVTLYCGLKRSKMLRVLKRYSGVIGCTPSISIKDFSQRTGDTQKVIKRNLEWLIEHNVLEDAFIDYEDDCIIFDKAYRIARAQEKWSLKYKNQKPEMNVQRVSVVCECCGAITMMQKETGGYCEYCRAPLGKENKTIDSEEIKYEME